MSGWRRNCVSDQTHCIGHDSVRAESWEALVRYVDDGHIEIDNNINERALRGVAWRGAGAQNYLFLGSDASGERAAAIYSLISTVRVNGHNPETWLKEVLEKIAGHPVNRVGELLPWNLVPKMPGAA